ncbi:uncharacterized protein LOC142319506 [Lycorma delicatula]|uniref:uncharacterized protein LOC142319506 n=1 Tax=Lycorma delicatula TaxID=130591 RepID=UPI003F514351
MSATTKKSGGRKAADIPLVMECVEEELSPAQIAAYNKCENDFNETLVKIESVVKKYNGTIIDKNDSTTLIGFPNNISHHLVQQSVTMSTGGTPMMSPVMKSKVLPTTVPGLSGQSNLTNLKSNTSPIMTLQSSPVAQTAGGIVTTSSMPQGGTYQLVMDPRLGLLVSTVSQPTSPVGPSTQVPVANSSSALQPNPTPAVMKSSQNIGANITAQHANLGVPRRQLAPAVTQKTASGKVFVPYNTTNTSPATYGPAKQKSVSIAQNLPNIRQSEATVSSTSNNTKNRNKASTPVIDLTDDDGKSCLADSREINFNNANGKTFPSLVVVARPHLKIKDMSQGAVADERKYFNDRVKSVLMFTPTKFTEWLIQQGLVRSEHYCSIHTNPDKTPIKLKLGMYSDLSKFPYSGGYVWISDCCPQRFVSVFSGSIFEGAPHAPSVLLKLLYHWCSQTSVQNVVQWVKVEKLYTKTFYTNLRAVCTAAICEKYEKLGGPEKKIEVGVISLGTTSSDGSMRQVKVEVLGVMDAEKKLIRLRAIEPLQDAERNFKKRFFKILEPLEQWVHKDSLILTDNTVDKSTLLSMGYKSIHQVSIHETNSTSYRYSNVHIMEYLRRVVPRMFQNTLSLLSRQIIQQFLDELVWRERWGHIPSRAFDSIIAHIAEQTKLESGDTLMSRLSKIAANPFKNWQYKNWKANCGGDSNLKPGIQNRSSTVTSVAESTVKRVKRKTTSTPKTVTNTPTSTTTSVSSQPQFQRVVPALSTPTQSHNITAPTELTPLESYYYGSLPGDPDLLEKERKYKLNMKCCVCRSVLPTNIQMMRHLIGHAFNEGAYGTEDSKLPQCRYCLKNFVSEFCLQSHLEESHLKTGSVLMCLICEEKFNDRTTLILHMHRNHTELELPYECGICGFRTSEHRLVVDHFYDVHNEGEKVQCPYCLKVVAFASNGRKVTQNLYFFLGHIQKHSRKTIARKCNKCALWFVHKGILKDHQNKDHASCKDMKNVERYSSSGLDKVMMPKPLAPGPLIEKHQIQKTKESLISNNFTAIKFDALAMYGTPDGATCCECEGDFVEEDHFPGYLSCLRCRFATCCSKAMAEHTFVFHDNRNVKEFNLGKVHILDKPMHCVCGFKSASGNKLAKHIATCGRKSAYPSADRAAQSTLQSQSASFPPLVTIDDQEEAETDPSDKWLQAFVSRKEKEKEEQVEVEKIEKPVKGVDPPSMLNVLGLVRKQSLDESSLDKPASDSEIGTQEGETSDSDSVKVKETEKEKLGESGLNEQTSQMEIDATQSDDVQLHTNQSNEVSNEHSEEENNRMDVE